MTKIESYGAAAEGLDVQIHDAGPRATLRYIVVSPEGTAWTHLAGKRDVVARASSLEEARAWVRQRYTCQHCGEIACGSDCPAETA